LFRGGWRAYLSAAMKLRERNLSEENRRLAAENKRLAERVVQQDAEIASLKSQLAHALQRIAGLEHQLAAARKDSSTSSKPPSSDIVKPPKAPRRDGSKRRRGGQPGHEQHLRSPFPPEAVDKVVPYTLACCPDCGGKLRLFERPAGVQQQVEIQQAPRIVTEHRALAYRCPHCRKSYFTSLPEAVEKAGLFGPRLTALVAYLKGVCHASFSTIRKFLRDVAGVSVSRGYLAKLTAKVSRSLVQCYDELFQRLPAEAVLNVDETGHPENHRKYWTWCFRAQLFTLFHIDKSRGSEVLVEMLGTEFNGVLGCDYFSAYRKYMRKFGVRVQFCMAHLIRDVKFLLTLPGREERAYGQRLRDALRELFAVIHRRSQASPGARISASGFRQALEAARQRVLWAGTTQVPEGKHAQNLAQRFRKHGPAYFRFITTPRIEPTNNLVEQAMRFVVIDRRITQGTRSEKGRRWCERIWTVIATCAQHGRSVFQFLLDSIQAHLSGVTPPSLLTSGP
jgi:transposase